MKLAALAVVAFFFFCSVSVDSAEQSVIGWWLFDEKDGDSVEDAAGKAESGRIIGLGQRVFRVEGRTGRALKFSNHEAGTREHGYVRLPGAGGHDFNRGMTVIVWFQPSSLEGLGGQHELVSNSIGGRGPGFRLFRWARGRISFRFGDGSDSWSATSPPELFPLRDENWYHVAGTFDGEFLRIYINGELAAEREFDGRGLTEGRNSINIGAYADGYAYGFNGVIDEVKLYNYALSHADIMEDFNR